jgi:hypothetical protein
MNRNNLIGEKSRYHQIYLKFRKEFTGTDEIAAVVESGDPERNRQFVERLAARLKTHPAILTDLFYKSDLTTLGLKALLLVPEPAPITMGFEQQKGLWNELQSPGKDWERLS